MRHLQNSTGSISGSETSGEAGDFAAPFARKNNYIDLTDRANSVPLSKVFKYYGLRLDESNRKIACPFKSHKGGRETTPSFKFYFDTNSYCCYGCRIGSRGCDFVAEMDRITKSAAASKILKIFSSDVDDDNVFDRQNFSEKLETMMEFSNIVREFLQANTDQKALIFIEQICLVYDDLNFKHKNLNNEALREITDQLKEHISDYMC
jgi:hypothetical protein